jgi:hypothetical protein
VLVSPLVTLFGWTIAGVTVTCVTHAEALSPSLFGSVTRIASPSTSRIGLGCDSAPWNRTCLRNASAPKLFGQIGVGKQQAPRGFRQCRPAHLHPAAASADGEEFVELVGP